MEIAGIILCSLFLVGYYGLITFSLRFCGVDFVKIFREEYVKILIIMALGTVFIAYQVSLQKTIYFWDYTETWEPLLFCEQDVFTDPMASLRELLHTINYSDYNRFLPMLMVLPLHFFGKSFLAYTLYVWIMFALPALFLTAAAIKSTLKKSFDVEISCSVALLILMFVPQLQIPVMNGYANISMMLLAIILWLILMNLDEEKFQPIRLTCAALLSMLAVIQSRTAAYMILGLYFGYIIYTSIGGGTGKLNFRVRFLATIKNLLCIGFIATVLMTLMFYPFVEHALTYDYGTTYSAYSLGYSFTTKILHSVLQGGVAIYSIFFIGVTVGLISKKFRPLTIFALAWAALPLILISRIQFLGMQHYYTMLTPFCAVVVVAILVGLRHSKIFGGVTIFLLVLNFVQVYTDILPTNPHLEKYHPPIRHDIDDFKNFVDEINSVANGRKIYLVSSSSLYNWSSFQKVYLPDKLNALPNFMSTADIDLRDGFRTEFFDADIVIVPTPAQIHLRDEKFQSVVVKLSELITSEPLSRHLKKIFDYDLKPNDNPDNPDYVVNFAVYEKISPFDVNDINFVENIFTELYPDFPDLFKNRFEQYKSEHFQKRGN